MSDKMSIRGIDPEGVADGDYAVSVAGGHVTGLSPASPGGGSGVVETIVPGTGISVDSTDPANPIVSTTGGGGSSIAMGCIAYHAAGSALPSSSSSQTINLDSEVYDPAAMHSTSVNNSRITVPTGAAGVYLIVANASLSVNAAGSRAARIRKNGAIVGFGPTVQGSVSSSADAQWVDVLAAGDYIEMAIYQDSGSTLTIASGTRLAVFRIA